MPTLDIKNAAQLIEKAYLQRNVAAWNFKKSCVCECKRARFPLGMRSEAKLNGVWLMEILKFFKATPHKACAQIAPSDFSSDCTSSTPAGWRPPRRTCAIWRKICKQDACKARSAGFVRCYLKSMAYRQHNLKASKLRSSFKKSAEICVKRLMIKKFKNPLDKNWFFD